MRKALLVAVACCLALASCTSRSDKYVDFLYAGMPLPDSAAHDRAWWQANVDKTLAVRDRMGWGVPEREFRHFVLPLRVNNEPLDDFRLLYADTLCARVAGLSLAEAAVSYLSAPPRRVILTCCVTLSAA